MKDREHGDESPATEGASGRIVERFYEAGGVVCGGSGAAGSTGRTTLPGDAEYREQLQAQFAKRIAALEVPAFLWSLRSPKVREPAIDWMAEILCAHDKDIDDIIAQARKDLIPLCCDIGADDWADSEMEKFHQGRAEVTARDEHEFSGR